MSKRKHDNVSQILPGDLPAPCAGAGAAAAQAEVGICSGGIPEEVVKIFKDAKLPPLMPKNWYASTEERHQKIAYNPELNSTWEIDNSTTWKKHTAVAVQFINLSARQFEMPGTVAPAAARAARFQELRDREATIVDSERNTLSLCLAHGGFSDVRSFQSDHAHPKSSILESQIELVKRLNDDSAFASTIESYPEFQRYFVKVDGKHYGTLYFYELYYNDINNLWLICAACNNSKSVADIEDWFREQDLYGDKFIGAVGGFEKEDGLTVKCKNAATGVAEAAIEWFWLHHERYANHLREIEKIKDKLLDKARRANAAAYEGQEARGARLRANATMFINLVSAIADGLPSIAKGREEGSHVSNDGGEYLSPVSDAKTEDYVEESGNMKKEKEPAQLVAWRLQERVRARVAARRAADSADHDDGADDVAPSKPSP